MFSIILFIRISWPVSCRVRTHALLRHCSSCSPTSLLLYLPCRYKSFAVCFPRFQMLVSLRFRATSIPGHLLSRIVTVKNSRSTQNKSLIRCKEMH